MITDPYDYGRSYLLTPMAADSLRWRWRDAPAAGAAPLETRMGSGWA
jgi:hypothetical protein